MGRLIENEGQHKKDRKIFKNNMALARYTEQMLKKQRKELGLPDPPLKIGNITHIQFKK